MIIVFHYYLIIFYIELACWRIYSFSLHDQYPFTNRLPIHLEDCQQITYQDDDDISHVLDTKGKTKLTEYFQLNLTDDFARTLLYHEIPKYYSWDNSKWKKRRKYIKNISKKIK